MTQYTKQGIESRFRNAARIRISQKKLGKKEYQNDAGYWEGGRCEWGGAHNLSEDCERLASFFGDITELRNSRKDLLAFNNETEFDNNKQALLNKVNSSLNGLNMKRGSTTSIGGVCIIWDDFKDSFEVTVNDFRKDLERLKADIERVPYNEAKELRKLESEERRIKKEIEENERRARNEPDENKKKQFMFLASQAKSKWKKLLERKQQLKTAHLGNNFDPDKHINDFLQKLEDRLSGRNRPTRNPNQPNPNSPNTPFEPDTPLSNPYSNYPNSTANDQPKPFWQEYWRELVLVSGLVLGVYYILHQPKEHE